MTNDPISLSMFIISNVMLFLWYIVDVDDVSAFLDATEPSLPHGSTEICSDVCIIRW